MISFLFFYLNTAKKRNKAYVKTFKVNPMAMQENNMTQE
jgi:hypothetical protein